MIERPAIPANLQPYVDVLGRDGAVAFFLALGGAELYFPLRPQAGSRLVQVAGMENAQTLGERLGPATLRVPTAKPFIAAEMKAGGASTAEIARTLHVSDVTVRNWLNPNSEKRQLSMF